MTVNNAKLSDYGGTLLGYDISPPEIKNSYFKSDNHSFPILYDTQTGLSELSVRLVFEATSRGELTHNLSKFRSLCHKQSEIRFKDNFVYDCIYKSEKIERVTETFCKVTIIFECLVRSELITKTITPDDNIIFNNGTQKSPCRLIISNNSDEDMKDVKVNDIVIKTIPQGKTVIIDGIKKTATMDGQNYYNLIEMTYFPCLEVGENVFDVSYSNKILVNYNIQY